MKLKTQNYGFESSLPENRITAKIVSNAKMFDILSSGIYSDPILAVVRELSCNAYDAQVDAGKAHVPFKVTLPTTIEPIFAVEDEGTGIEHELVGDIFWVYGDSTKSERNDQIGALGLGCKSPYAYTKSSFVVRNRYNGTERTLLCFIGESGDPEMSVVGEGDTDQPNGIRVELAVRPADVNAFADRATRFFRTWEATMPEFNIELNLKVDKAVEGDGWHVQKADTSLLTGAIALMGNVPYPISPGAVPNMPSGLANLLKNKIVIRFPMGSLSFAASRETLKYDEATCKALIERVAEVNNEIYSTFLEQAIESSSTPIEFVANFRRMYNDSIAVLSSGYKGFPGKIIFQGNEYTAAEIVEGIFKNEMQKHSSIGLVWIWLNARGRAMASNKTFITYSRSEDTPAVSGASSFVQDTWRSVRKSMKDPDFFEKAMKSEEYDVVTTEHSVIVGPVPPTFVINDVGSSGLYRLKLVINKNDSRWFQLQNRKGAVVFVDLDCKATTIAQAQAELAEALGPRLAGAKVILLSSLPDLREETKKKREMGNVRLKASIHSMRRATFSMDVDGTEMELKNVLMAASKYTTTEAVSVSSLVNKDVVLYVNLSHFGTAKDEIVGNDKRIPIASFLGFDFDKIMDTRNRMVVYHLTEGQIKRLTKAGVCLKKIGDLINEHFNLNLMANGGFLKMDFSPIVKIKTKIEQLEEFSDIFNIDTTSLMKFDSLSNESYFGRIARETVKLRKEVQNISTPDVVLFAYDELMSTLVKGHTKTKGHYTSEFMGLKLKSQYPLLGILMQFRSSIGLDSIVDYVRTMDRLTKLETTASQICVNFDQERAAA